MLSTAESIAENNQRLGRLMSHLSMIHPNQLDKALWIAIGNSRKERKDLYFCWIETIELYRRTDQEPGSFPQQP